MKFVYRFEDAEALAWECPGQESFWDHTQDAMIRSALSWNSKRSCVRDNLRKSHKQRNRQNDVVYQIEPSI